MRKVVITDRPLPHVEEERKIIEAAGGVLHVHDCRSEKELRKAVEGAYIIQVNLARLDRDLILSLKGTKGIVRYGIGYDNVDVAAATQKGIYLANAAGYCAIEVAEHTISLLLAMTRRIAEFDRYVRSGSYKDTSGYKHYLPIPRLAGKKVGIIGFGKIGREVARRLLAFGVSLFVHDPYLPRDAGDDLLGHVTITDLDTLLRESDIITIHAPRTQETEGMIGEEELGIMKPTALLLNAARGGIVNEKALAEAVASGRIGGAAVDTLTVEPPPESNPLLGQPRILVTPHVAWYSEEAVLDLERIVAGQTAEMLRGKTPTNLVNRELAQLHSG